MKTKRNQNYTIKKIAEALNENEFHDILSYLQQRIHAPGHNVLSQHYKRSPEQEYNWWKDNQGLI